MTDSEILDTFNRVLASHVWESHAHPRPLLAHYCTTASLESIFRTKEIWLSNPLFMNDLEEVRFGVATGLEIVDKNEQLLIALGTEERKSIFAAEFSAKYFSFINETAFDVYVTCFSGHETKDYDGRLSMWRAYAGSGDGAAIVFDLNPVSNPDTQYNGLILGQVRYGDTATRTAHLKHLVELTARMLGQMDVGDDQLHIVASTLFVQIKLAALFTKHIGFSEEQEWRLVYIPQHDIHEKYRGLLHYKIGRRGVEPILQLPIHGKVPWQEEAFDLHSIVNRVILGPSVSDELSKRSIGRMFDKLEFPRMAERLASSSIPLRASGK